MLKVLFFASLRERLNCAGLDWAEPVATVNDLREALRRRDENWHEALADRRLLVAVNQTMVQGSTQLQPGDEVAFFPPVTGG